MLGCIVRVSRVSLKMESGHSVFHSAVEDLPSSISCLLIATSDTSQLSMACVAHALNHCAMDVCSHCLHIFFTYMVFFIYSINTEYMGCRDCYQFSKLYYKNYWSQSYYRSIPRKCPWALNLSTPILWGGRLRCVRIDWFN